MDYNLDYELLNDANNIFKEVSYDELMDLVNGFTTGIFYIGGAWCKNCQAIAGLLNSECKKKFVDTIYNFVPKYTNDLGEEVDIRSCLSLEDKLKYYDLVEKIGFNNSSDETVTDTLITKMHVPFIFALKNGVCVDFFSMELIYENGLYVEEGHSIDMKDSFINRLDLLIDKLM